MPRQSLFSFYHSFGILYLTWIGGFLLFFLFYRWMDVNLLLYRFWPLKTTSGLSLFSTPLYEDVLFLFTYDLEPWLKRQFTILQKSGNFRIPESLPCLHDKLLTAAADATISLSPNQKITQVGVMFQAFCIFPQKNFRAWC